MRAAAIRAAFAVATVCVVAAASTQQTAGRYPVPGRQAGTTAFSREASADHLASSQYPTWFRGTGRDGRADERSSYFFTQLVGAPAAVNASGAAVPGAAGLRMGTLSLRPGATYPAHNHPAREIYYVTAGEADWFVDDEKQHVVAGSVIMHRPYAVHGWTNTSKDQPLKVVWIRWLEGQEPAAVLDQGAQFVNPDLSQEEATAEPFAVPIPATHR